MSAGRHAIRNGRPRILSYLRPCCHLLYGNILTDWYKQGAAYWLTWLMQPENLVFYNTQGGFVPPTAAARAKWEADPVIKAWGDQVQYIVVDADTQYYFQNSFDFITPALDRTIVT